MEAKAARPITADKHMWYAYTGKKVLTLKDKNGNTIQLKKGDLFGVYNLSDRIDRVVTPDRPDLRFLLPVETVSDVIDQSKRHRDPVQFANVEKPAKGPKKIKIEMTPSKKEKSAPPTKADRLKAIKKAALKDKAKPVNKDGKAQLEIIQKKPVKRNLDLDEDTFNDDDDNASMDLHDYMR